MGAGGELGIYSNYINIHSLAETKNPIYSELRVFYKGKKIIEYNPRCLCWWINGFNPKIQNIKTSNDLSLKCTADFSNVSKDLRKAFYKKQRKVMESIGSKQIKRRKLLLLSGDEYNILEKFILGAWLALSVW